MAAEQDAELARAKLARLAPGHIVFPHMDRGDYYRWHDRYHLVLRSPTGSILRAGGGEVRMREGELWWFDNKAVHDAENTGRWGGRSPGTRPPAPSSARVASLPWPAPGRASRISIRMVGLHL